MQQNQQNQQNNIVLNTETAETRWGTMAYYAGDQFVGASLQAYGEYSPDEERMLRSLVDPDSVVIEVGANIGALTVPLARAVPQGHVWAFEAEEDNFELLLLNTQACGNVDVCNYAIGDRFGNLVVPKLYALGHSNFGAIELTAEVVADRPSSIALLRPLDTWLDKFERLDLLKIDVEGMETEVLRGARKLIMKYRPFIYLENDRPEKMQAALQMLHALGYIVTQHNPPLFEPDNWNNNRQYIWSVPNIASLNLLCCPAERVDRCQRFSSVMLARVQAAGLGAPDAFEKLCCVVATNPANVDAWASLAAVCSRYGSLVPASIAAFRRALELDPGRNKMWVADLAYQLVKVGHIAEATELSHELRRRFPGDSLTFWIRSTLQSVRRNHKEAVEWALKAVEADPESVSMTTHAGQMEINAGQFISGLHHYEARILAHPEMAHLWQNSLRWNGQPCDHLFLAVDEGLGDTISMARFLSLPMQRCRKVTISGQRSQHHFIDATLKRDFSNYTLIDRWEMPADAQCWTSLMHIPVDCGLTDEEFRKFPHPRWELPEMRPLPRDGRFHIGVTWRGNPMTFNAIAKAFPLEQLLDLYAVPGIKLYSLQLDGTQEIIEKGAAVFVDDVAPLLTSFFHTMAVIKQLDLIITVDGIVSHMAGVLGHPCWVPVPMYGIDWRAGNGCYPNHRGFKQTKHGDWDPPFAEIQRELGRLVRSKQDKRPPMKAVV